MCLDIIYAYLYFRVRQNGVYVFFIKEYKGCLLARTLSSFNMLCCVKGYEF